MGETPGYHTISFMHLLVYLENLRQEWDSNPRCFQISQRFPTLKQQMHTTDSVISWRLTYFLLVYSTFSEELLQPAW